jgi:head-tail adaptor
MACKRKRFIKTEICIGDLRNQIEIQERSLLAAGFDDNEPTESFTTIATVFAGIKTATNANFNTALFNGVSLDQVTTHTFTISYDPTLKNLENGNNFILFNDRRFKILRRSINDENDIFIDLFCSERGLSSQSASEA